MTAAPRQIPNAILDAQQGASDPAASAWVSANAGSGKTYVLAQRVIRLLLEGTSPSKILCLTYTKAAAANMANRVFDQLARWATLDDASLKEQIGKTGAKRIDSKRLARARRLFAEALETPGGLKVQTIHAFCTRLLQQFPFEADVAARFQVLEETQQRQMLEDIRMDVLLAASAKPESAEGRALTTIITLATDFAFQLALPEAIREHRWVTEWLDRAGGVEGAMAELSQALDIRPEETIESVEKDLFDSPLIAPAEWTALIAILMQGSKTDREQAARLEIVRTTTGTDRFAALLTVFCTVDGAAKSSIVTKGLRDKHPDLCKRFLAEQDRVCVLLDRRRAAINRARTGALLTIADQVITCYQAGKQARGLLDYDDLIAKTRDLLTQVSAAWVHYKLDLGIDHLLIDEAQDTSPEQWDIIERLVAEFAAGAGARGPLKRSIFAVGDDKQSIFSFQGAAPSEFGEKRSRFEREFKSAKMDWRNVRLDYSFRSNESVLTAVQQVFREQAIYRSVTADADGISPHLALPDAAPGFVELWPIVKPDEREQVEPWDSPFDKSSETSPRVRLARQIAKAVRLWIDRKERVGTGRDRHDVRPGDILVLVRQRGPLFEAIIRTLKNENIAVAGADRLMLTDHIAIMDLLALADAVLLPDDDLALATVLKSPLFGLTEEELFALAWDRKGTLRAALAERKPELAAHLDAIARDARRLAPFGFYAGLLGAEHGRKRFVARLGLEANDVLDEFLNLALTYESRETPSLQGFVAWLRTASAEIKRDMELARDEVRVMTVHGAKGLEAPIVILADTTTPPEGPIQHQPRLLALPAQNAPPGTPDRLVWIPSKKDDTAPIAAARAAARRDAEDEYRRLLYVAMTRAADRLVICGSDGRNRRPDGCWYNLVTAALNDLCTEEPADVGEGTVLRFRKTEAKPEALSLFDTAPAKLEPHKAPDWLLRNVRAETVIATPLSPSRAYDEAVPHRRAPANVRKAALARGVAMHRLLQSLPDVPPAQREEAAARYLARSKEAIAAEDCESIVAGALRVLDGSTFSELFQPGSRAEVPVVGRVEIEGRTFSVEGVVDRLCVTESAVLIADYKTNRPPPKAPPQAYVAQLALYRAVLARLYPGRPIRAALIWTETPELIELSGEAMDAALAAYAVSRANLDAPETRS
jgi:ATP-dependent helicase/nuclease subunit A